jgi:flagellar M-ring protein FliF
MDQFTKLGPVQALIKFWGTLSNTQRFITAVFIATSIVLLVVVSVVATKPGMAVLFSGLQPEDAGTIVSKLQESKIPYEIDGTTIKVPVKQVHETRMKLASQGLPASGGIGFEIFDKGGIGMTEFQQQLNYQRALQGELSRSIDQIDCVAQSRVHIAIPKDSVYTEKDKSPTASVELKLKSGARPTGDQIAGIVHLVSSAVQGLTPEHITVIDTNGNMLSEPTNEATGLNSRLSSSQLRLKNEYESQVQQNIQSMLERVLGANKAVVRVCAKINFNRKETNSETYQPVQSTGNTGVIESETRTEESYNGSRGGQIGGVVGTRSNINPGSSTATITPEMNEKGYNRTEIAAKYQVSKTVAHEVSAPGQVDNVSVAVMVDGKVEPSKISAIQNVVATAAGIDTARGDKVTVESMVFDDSAAKKEAKELQSIESRNTLLSVGKTIGGVLLLLGFLFFLRMMLKQIKVQVSVPETTVEQLQLGQTDDNLQGYDSVVQIADGLPPSGIDGLPSDQSGPEVSTRDQVAQAQPQEVAKALRSWMSE